MEHWTGQLSAVTSTAIRVRRIVKRFGLAFFVESVTLSVCFVEYTVGRHDDAVRCIEHSEDKNIIASGSWDRLVKLWDGRSLGPVGVHSQQDQVRL